MADDLFAQRPYTEWLEGMVKGLYDVDPQCVMVAMRNKDGESFTSYWQLSADDRAILVDAIQRDGLMQFVDMIFGGEVEDEDGETEETDSETDCEG